MLKFVFLKSTLNSIVSDQIAKGLEFIKFSTAVHTKTKVFLKPNLTFPTFRPGVMTTPECLESTIIALKDYTSNIYIGDADSGGYNPFSMDIVYQQTGVADIAKRYGAHIINLSKCDRKSIHFSYKGKDFSLDLPRMLMEDMDFLITMPVPKVHNMTGVSLSFKNQWGCIPEPNDRLRLHPYFQHVILEVNKAVKTKFVIMDGTYGLNDNGPMLGEPVELNWIMVADDPGAAAQIACDIMQIPLESISHLRYLKEQGLIPPRADIQLNTDIKEFQNTRFYLKRKLTDYPGYLAFNNPFLAWLAYFSPLSDVLHKILYLFRKPFYDYDKYSKRK